MSSPETVPFLMLRKVNSDVQALSPRKSELNARNTPPLTPRPHTLLGLLGSAAQVPNSRARSPCRDSEAGAALNADWPTFWHPGALARLLSPVTSLWTVGLFPLVRSSQGGVKPALACLPGKVWTLEDECCRRSV